ncbi:MULTISPECIES: hypothetical protein [Pseudomonas]|jgi:hypothetical protein|nr:MULTISPECIES: hypothetical protein [Pseudomonas]MDB6445105.1 hypothetical protein [Pseudomonas sp. 21TX0197]MDT8907600.1 hypothetical protein [Pseudomonas prosekii]NHN70287.1 hypothetical protein [Pseudomonas fluorescens]ROO39210.1 hypothetical protein BIV08_18275 [Pseudomonas sp. AF76]ROO39450.1 hypothetical protein BIV09_12225 [Pseudomonas sp. 7SR1]
MNRLINGLTLAALLAGIHQIALADDCTEGWRKSSAAQSCGAQGQGIGGGWADIKDEGNGQCLLHTWCTVGPTHNGMPNSFRGTPDTLSKLQNINGVLKVAP